MKEYFGNNVDNSDDDKSLFEDLVDGVQTEGNESKPVKEKKSLFGKKKNEQTEFVSMDGIGDTEEVVIVGQDVEEIARRSFFATVRISLYVIIAAIVFVLAFLGLMFKVVPDNVQGNSLHDNRISIVPNSFQTDTSLLKSGDVVLVSDQPDWIPVYLNYNKYQVLKREGSLVYVTNVEGGDGRSKAINVQDIDYIE